MMCKYQGNDIGYLSSRILAAKYEKYTAESKCPTDRAAFSHALTTR